MPKRNTFCREFKLVAIRQMETGDKKTSDLARELGVPRNKLYKWHEKLKAKDSDTSFSVSSRRRGKDAELAVLQRENERPDQGQRPTVAAHSQDPRGFAGELRRREDVGGAHPGR